MHILVSRISGLTLAESTLYGSPNDDEYLGIDANAFVSRIIIYELIDLQCVRSIMLK